jgi:hypothetical protein
MNKIDQIQELAQKILDQNKQEFTMSEMAILLQSQYFNIEEMFSFGANYTEDNIDNQILISQEIIKLCNSYFNNLKLVPNINWEDSKNQKERVTGILKEVNKSLELQIALRNHKNINSLGTMMELNRIMRENNRD